MKDYYYFLGIKDDASDEDIKTAYRKLSMKYHPDKNDNDPFFAQRFMEIQEAYETLSDPQMRRNYDHNIVSGRGSSRSSLPPTVKNFTSNKVHAVKGEEVIIKWNTLNADVVKIVPFGLEKAYGERTFRITEFKNGKFVIILHAANSLTRQTAVKGITITEVFENDRERFRENVEKVFQQENKAEALRSNTSAWIRILLAVLLLAAALYFIMQEF
ncbi:J domain-containing protein [Chryseobacterium sp.]|uniref:J domain-containing protein n=1 Tax=Chryseobacterium sp. TaxID=1871047 RepID=UPI0012A979D7|nr:J domain-containing protein [Chryseobacterium sp.]QFG52835.1 J domain-containing protein [Chryseobacterium sp.]